MRLLIPKIETKMCFKNNQLTWPRFEPRTSWIQVLCRTTALTCSKPVITHPRQGAGHGRAINTKRKNISITTHIKCFIEVNTTLMGIFRIQKYATEGLDKATSGVNLTAYIKQCLLSLLDGSGCTRNSVNKILREVLNRFQSKLSTVYNMNHFLYKIKRIF